MYFTQIYLEGAYTIDLERREDERGFFARYFCEKEFAEIGLSTRWVQMNNSLSRERGTLRGLHFQCPPMAEVKVVRCLRGAIWDVIVDVRKESVTFGKWYGAELNEKNRTMMYVPEGFAHGFISLQRDSEILYMVSKSYAPDYEQTLNWNDQDVGIDWPIEPLVISEKDKHGTTLAKLF